MASKQHTRRIIDDYPPVEKRPVEMQVLGFGMSRTATMSFYRALPMILNAPSYHCSEMHNSPVPDSTKLWREAIGIKYGGKYGIKADPYGNDPLAVKGKLPKLPYGNEEFDKLLENYAAITDIPCILFADELLAAYPNAKVVLTMRDPDKWVESVYKTLYVLESWKWERVCWLDPDGVGALWYIIKSSLLIWTKGDIYNKAALKQGFIEHYAHVKAVVPKENLLEFNSADGWGPLCKFLGKEIPEEKYPRINDADSTVKLMTMVYRILWVRAATNVAKKSAPWLVAAGAALGGWYYSVYMR